MNYYKSKNWRMVNIEDVLLFFFFKQKTEYEMRFSDWSSDVCSSDRYQPVGDVPNLLVLVAGTTNLIERALVETIDDNTLDPNIKIEFGAGGHTFDLFFNAVSPRGPITDTFLDATIKDY